MMGYKIQNTYKTKEVHEFSVDWNGFNFLIIYGKHINGWFIAIPNWNICTEAGEPTSVAYNAEKLEQTHIHDDAPIYLARAIREHWEKIIEEKGRGLCIEIMETIEKSNMETLTQKIKGLPGFAVYEKAVKESGKDGNTAMLLQETTLMTAMFDGELKAMMYSVSNDLLFAMIDQRLRNEILQEPDGGNAESE